MRQHARRLASTTLGAFLLLGVTGPVAMAAVGDLPRERTAAVAQEPVADAQALLARAKSLGDLSDALKPAIDLLNAVVTANSGQITPEESAKYAAAVKDAIAKVGAAQAATLPAPAAAKAAPTPDLTADSLAALQKSVDALLKAATSGDASQVAPAAAGVVTGLVDVVAAALLGGGMPAQDLAGLPTLPAAEQSTAQLATAQLPASQPHALPVS